MKYIYTLFLLILFTFLHGQSVTNLKSMVGNKDMKVMYTNMEVNFCSECHYFGKITYKLHEESKESFICFDNIQEELYEILDGEIISIKGKFNGLICDDGEMYYMFEALTYSAENTVSRNLIREKLPDPEEILIQSFGEVGSNLTAKQAHEALELHNRARAEVGVPPLSWSSELARHAQIWADYLATTGNCQLEHRKRDGEGIWNTTFGENLALISTSNSINPALKGSELWYAEIKDFQNVTLDENNWSKAGHYSQMIWSSTQELGIGVATCPNGYNIIVASYNQAGNMLGEKAY
jgi:uncharacterized protein YkwD